MARKTHRIIAKSDFQTAIESTAEIATGYRPGLQALKDTESGKITAVDTRKLNGSVDIDSTVKQLYPEDNRWDYAIGYNGSVCFVEIHPASTSEVTTIEAKLTWLKKWLSEKAPRLNEMPKTSPAFVWVQTKGCSILPQSSQYRRLSKLGIKPVASHKLG